MREPPSLSQPDRIGGEDAAAALDERAVLDMAPVQLDDDLTSRLSFVWYFAAWFKRQDV